ncbi:hypothetical protein P7H22_16820 [Paenibacillus larvae]|nr:hypothetical protein [Paenibacillus larvae]MDT2241681.1 hypothetical protein [Paenibacillus larvae]
MLYITDRRGTVNKSYTLLKQDGFIQVHRQKGVVVQPDGMPGVTPDYLTKLDNQLPPRGRSYLQRDE